MIIIYFPLKRFWRERNSVTITFLLCCKEKEFFKSPEILDRFTRNADRKPSLKFSTFLLCVLCKSKRKWNFVINIYTKKKISLSKEKKPDEYPSYIKSYLFKTFLNKKGYISKRAHGKKVHTFFWMLLHARVGSRF